MAGLTLSNLMLGLGIGNVGTTLSAPTLAYTAATNPPQFAATLVLPEVDDVIRLQIDADTNFTAPIEYTLTNTLDGAEVAALEADFTGSSLAAGNWFARARHERGGTVSQWSNVESWTVADTAPTISSSVPTDNATGVAVDSTIAITFSHNIQFITSAGTVVLRDNDGGWADLETFTPSSLTAATGDNGGSASISGAVLTITPGTDMVGGIEHAIRIASNAVEEIYGTNFAGIADDTTLSFTIASAGYTELPVTFDGTNDWLNRGGALTSVADGKTALFFFSVDFTNTASASEIIVKQAGGQGLYVNRAADAKIYCYIYNTSAAIAISLNSTTAVGAERANILVAADADGSSYLYLWTPTLGAWSLEKTDSAGTGVNLDFTQADTYLGSNFTSTKLAANVQRMAMWFNPASLPDITSSAVRDNFINSSTGALVDPATSITAYGTPDIEFAENATAWNAGTNQGSGGDFTMNGAVVDA